MMRGEVLTSTNTINKKKRNMKSEHMSISSDDIIKLFGRPGEKDAIIARLQMVIEDKDRRYDEKCAECEEWKMKFETAQAMAENERYNNMWLRTFIRLSMEKVKNFFTRQKDLRLLSFAQSFILSMMPDDAPAEEMLLVTKATSLPESCGQGDTIVNGNYLDIHDNGGVKI